jgi:large subunit ribosomal protein L30
MAKIKVTQVRSIINCLTNQKRTIKALGLGRPNQTVIVDVTPQIAGMINTIKHLVKTEAIND